MRSKPGKRPAHTLNTYMVFRDDEVFAVGGSPGADDQPQTNFQIIHDLVDLRMDPQSAVEAPRWSHQPGTPPRDQLPEALRIEEGSGSTTLDSLREKGSHSVARRALVVRQRESDCQRSRERLLARRRRPAPCRLRVGLLIRQAPRKSVCWPPASFNMLLKG